MDCNQSGSSVHGNLQARILEWVAIPFSRGSSRPRDWTPVSHIAGWYFTVWATRETQITYIHIMNINKGPSSQSYGFSSSHIRMWELDHKESWMPKIDAFELWCWRRLLRDPWIARRSNQSSLKEISPECSLEGLMLELKFHYVGHLIRRTDSLKKILMLGKIEGRRRRGQQRMRWLPTLAGAWGRQPSGIPHCPARGKNS